MPAFGIVAAFVADNDAGPAHETAKAADDGLIFRKGAVAGQRREILDQLFDVIEAMRPVGVPRDLHLLRRCQLAVYAAQLAVDLILQLANLIGDVNASAVGNMAQLFNLSGFQVSGDGLFPEIEGLHGS